MIIHFYDKNHTYSDPTLSRLFSPNDFRVWNWYGPKIYSIIGSHAIKMEGWYQNDSVAEPTSVSFR